MKRLFFLGLAIVLSLTACQKTEKRYTQQSVEIDTYKKVIDAYEKQDWEALMSHYADTAKIMNNVIEKEGKTIAEEVAIGKEDAALFSSWDYVDGESEYEMVVTDKGQTWVNFWGIWKGPLAANNKTYWDVSKIMMDIQTMEQAELSTMKDTIN